MHRCHTAQSRCRTCLTLSNVLVGSFQLSGLSRLPLGNHHEASLDCIVIDAFTIGQIQALPVTTDQVKTATRQDRVLSQVNQYTMQGWPKRLQRSLSHLLGENTN